MIPISPFENRPVVVVAGGPSLTLSQVRIVGMARAQDICRVIAVNDAVYPCWFADIHHAGDKRWHDRHGELGRYPGLQTAIQETGIARVRTMEDAGRVYLGDEGLKIGNWRGSGSQAVHLAARLYARRIVLLGFDFSGDKSTNDGTRDHWFGRHEPRMDINSDVDEIKRVFRILTDHLTARRVEIVNCSPGSAINWLPVSTIEQEFPDI